MRILAISDIHCDFEAFAPTRMPAADLCIVAGDLTNYGIAGTSRLSAKDIRALWSVLPPALLKEWRGQEIAQAEQWLRGMAALFPVLWIPGNHDIGVDATTLAGVPNCTCILNRTIEMGGFRIHGVSLAPCYDKPLLAGYWDYMTRDPEEERAAFDFEDVDIVVSHSPPFGHCDVVGFTLGGAEHHIGSARLLEYIQAHSPRLVICGHIHEGQGESRIQGKNGTTRVFNVAETFRSIRLD